MTALSSILLKYTFNLADISPFFSVSLDILLFDGLADGFPKIKINELGFLVMKVSSTFKMSSPHLSVVDRILQYI